MKRRTKTRLLPMDELQYRPCEVDGVPALFHRWIEDDRVLLKVGNNFESESDVRRCLNLFYLEDVVGPNCSTDVLRETFALVEYRDGTVAKVKPELVRFLAEDDDDGRLP